MISSFKQLSKVLHRFDNNKLPEFVDVSRRELLSRLGLGAAGALGVSALAGCGNGLSAVAASSSNDVATLNAALAIEQEAIAIYTAAAGLNIWTAGTSGMPANDANAPAYLMVAGSFLAHHTTHAASLKTEIQNRGGTPGTALTATQYLANNGVTNPASLTLLPVLQLAQAKEKAAAKAYASLASNFLDVSLAGLFATLAADEGAHYGIYRAAFAFLEADSADGGTPATVIPGAFPANW